VTVLAMKVIAKVKKMIETLLFRVLIIAITFTLSVNKWLPMKIGSVFSPQAVGYPAMYRQFFQKCPVG
jgi:hypothetical protein